MAPLPFEEYRTDLKQRSIEPSTQVSSVRGYGFANQWLLFSPANQSDFRFRYLGQQEMGGRKTFAVAFAQIPEQTSNPAQFVSGGSTIPFFYQGVMWIDQKSSAIVLLRTDLLAPLPSLRVKQMTTELHFHSVHIRGTGMVLWLPREVQITVAQGHNVMMELHSYSDYRLYNVQSKILFTH